MKNTIRFAAFILSLTLLSCGGGEHSATDTGSASFGLKFEEASAPAMKLAPSMAPVDICSSYGIDSISGTVYNSSSSIIATGGPWACSAHQGTINNIPPGSNLRITIKGTVAGSVVWQGETTGATIYAGQDTNVGSIPMAYTGSDTTSPTVTAATPTGTNVPLTSPITVTFSEAMASSTIDSTTFTLQSGSVPVPGSVSYNATTKTATFTPTSSLSNSVIYTATITADVTDMAANRMQSLYAWDFTTEAAPGSAPAAPTGVLATAADKQVTISWTAVSGATSYNIYWSNTTSVTKTNGTQITGETSPYIHTALTNGTTYYYIVTAVNEYGESEESSQASATPSSGGDITAPANTTAENFINSGAASTSSTGVTLAVNATDNVGVTAYYVSESSAIPSATATGWGALSGATSYTIINVSFILSSGDGTKTVYVWFKDTAGNVSASASDSITLSTGTAPSVSIDISATAGDSQIQISWTGSTGATSYNVYWSTTSGVTKTNGTKITGAISPYTHTSLANGTTYYYVVTAVNEYGESGESSEANASPNRSGITGKVPDTGQTIVYATGDDGSYANNLPSYTDNGNGTIMDDITGLIWQKQDDVTTRTWNDAVTYCNSLTLAGYTGWHLPTDFELLSIVDYGKYNPAINTTYFPNTQLSSYWSSTTIAFNTTGAWIVSFKGGGMNTYSKTTDLKYVRCVR